MNLLSDLFRKKPSANAIAPKQSDAAPRKEVYLTKTVTFGMHPHRSATEDSSVFFVDESRGIRKMIVDSRGNIQNFPGIKKEDFWVRDVAPNYLKPQIRFRSSFETRDCGWIFLWQLQPDGWYWADEDGFGGEDDPEVILYTFLDRQGNFSGPFQIYQFGSRGFAMDRFLARHDRSQKWAMEAASDDENYVVYPGDIFPQLWGCPADHESDKFYQLWNREEALEYWSHPVLAEDLLALARALLDSKKSLWQMMGRASHCVKASMTLFYALTKEPVFQQVLDKFFDGQQDAYTLANLSRE